MNLFQRLLAGCLSVLMIGHLFPSAIADGLKLPKNITTISEKAFFKDESLTTVTIPEGAQRIESQAFADCKNLWVVDVPDSVSYIAPDAFDGSDLVSLRVPHTNYALKYAEDNAVRCRISGADYAGIAGSDVWYTLDNGVLTLSGNGKMQAGTAASDYPWFHVRDEITEIYVSEGVKSIGDYAFWECTELQKVFIAESVTNIGRFAFGKCPASLRFYCPLSTYAEGWGYDNGKNVCGTVHILSPIKDASFFSGETVSLHIDAEGSGLTYHWEYQPREETEKWYPAEQLFFQDQFGATSPNLSREVYWDNDGWKFRCTVTDGKGYSAVSNVATIHLCQKVEIVNQPHNVNASIGSQAMLSIEAIGDGLTYEWEYSPSSGYGSLPWRHLKTTYEPFLLVDVTSTAENRLYHCIVTDQYGNSLRSAYASIIVNTYLTSISDVSVTADSIATFSVGYSGTDVSLQWQVCAPDSSVWENISGAVNCTLRFTATAQDNGKRFRCVGTGRNSVEYSNEALLTVHVPVKSISLDASELEMNVGQTQRLTASVLPQNADNKHVIWQTSNSAIVNISDSGLLRAGAKEGSAVITASTEDGGFVARCTVTVKNRLQVPNIKLSTTNAAVNTSVTAEATLYGGLKPYEVKLEYYNLDNPSVPIGAAVTTTTEQDWAITEWKIAVPGEYFVMATLTDATGKSVAKVSDSFTIYQRVTGISLSRTSLTMDINSTAILTANVIPSNATNPGIVWTAADSTIVQVEDGKIVAQKAGTTKVTARITDYNIEASCYVTVVIPTQSVILSDSSVNLAKGSTITLSAAPVPANATDFAISSWSSSNNSVATVENGLVTALSAGTARVTVRTKTGHTESCTVTVWVPDSGITLNTNEKAILARTYFNLTAKLQPSNTVASNVTWASSNTSVASVSDGRVFAVSAGTAVITAKTQSGFTASCQITVFNPLSIDKIALRKESLSVNEEGGGFDVEISGGVAPYDVRLKLYKTDSSNLEASNEWIGNSSVRYGYGVNFCSAGQFYLVVEVQDALRNSFDKKSEIVTVRSNLSVTSTEAFPETIPFGDCFHCSVKLDGGVAPYVGDMLLYKEGNSNVIDSVHFESSNSPGHVWSGIYPEESGQYYIVSTVTDACGTTVGARSNNVAVDPVISTSLTTDLPEYLTMTVGETRQFFLRIDPQNVSDRECFINISDGNVVSVDTRSAVITALNPGNARITFCARDEGSSTYVDITVQAPISDINTGEIKTSQAAQDFIKAKEHLILSAYDDGGGYLTIGWGHRLYNNETSLTITREQAEIYFQQDLHRVEGYLDEQIHNRNLILNQQQYDAIISLLFNLSDSSKVPALTVNRLGRLLTEFCEGTQKPIPADRVWECFVTYHHVLHEDWPGLFMRRMQEAVIFIYGEYDPERKWPLPEWLAAQSEHRDGGDVPDGWTPDGPAPSPANDTVGCAALDNLTDSRYAYCYAISNGTVIPYTDSSLSRRGTTLGESSTSYIDGASDELQLLGVGKTNGTSWAKVSYPTGNGKRKTAYIPLSDLVYGTNDSSTRATRKYYVSDKRGASQNAQHYVDAGDTVYLLYRSGNECQIMYPVSGGNFRIAWCSADDYDNKEPKPTPGLIFTYASASDSKDAFGKAGLSFSYSALQNNAARENAVNAILQNSGYSASSLQAVKKLILFADGYGSSMNEGSKTTSLCVVFMYGKVIYATDQASTLPDNPFDSAGNHTTTDSDWTDVGTLLPGAYSTTAVRHHDKYPALNISGAQVYRIHMKVGAGNKEDIDKDYEKCPLAALRLAEGVLPCPAINIHYAENPSSVSPGSIPFSAGCINIQKTQYGYFAAAVGFANITNSSGIALANIGTGAAVSCSAKVLVNRSYGYDNVRNYRNFLEKHYTNSDGLHESAIQMILYG